MAEENANNRTVEDLEKDYLRCLIAGKLIDLSHKVALSAASNLNKMPSYEDMKDEATRIINLVNEYRR